MNLRQLVYGVLSFAPGLADTFSKGTGGTDSARYCYCIWLRHLVLSRMHGGATPVLRVVGELGPGDSIGTGLAALISGAERYVALDAVAHADTQRNLQVFDELVALFKARAPIPGPDEFPEITLDLPELAFPSHILDDARLDAALDPMRLAGIRNAIASPRPDIIDYRAPWHALQSEDHGVIDFLLSNAVLEHVSDLPTAYRAMAQWLRSGGIASHQIDFRSHGLFAAWDGHWACPGWLWRLFVGRRPYLLNREPFATHRTLGCASGLQEVAAIRIECTPQSMHLASRFANMSEKDRRSCGGYLLQQRP